MNVTLWSAQNGGYIFADHPDIAAPEARLLWSAEVDPSVLTAAVSVNDAPTSEYFDLARFRQRAFVARDASGEYVAIVDGGVALRLDIAAGSVCAGPVLLEHRLIGVSTLAAQMPALQQFVSLCRTGKMAAWRETPDPRLPRLIVALRIMDALDDGASLRTIASTVLSGVGNFEWPGPGDSTRSSIRRLATLARRLKRLGPKGVLTREI